MPLLVYASDVRATNERVVLRLKAAHSLLVGELGDASFTLKKPLPASIDVYSHTDLLVVVSAVLDARRMTSEDVKQSIITRHLVQMFRNNAALLGINNVSNAYIDESDGQVKVNITPQRSVPSHNPVSQVALVSIHLTYYCKAVKDSTDSPSTAKYGLTCNLLNQVFGNFITRHVVKRYPLIFGPWGEKLEQEKIYFPSIARSLFSMAQRSPNEEFRIQVKRHLKILSKRLKAAARDVLGDLQDCCSELIEGKALPGSDGDAARTDEDVICLAMERLFKVALRPSLIKCESVIEESLDLTTGESTNRFNPGEVLSNDGTNLHFLGGDINIDAYYGEDDLNYDSELEDNAKSIWAMDRSSAVISTRSSETICSWPSSQSNSSNIKPDLTDVPLELDDIDVYPIDQDTSTILQYDFKGMNLPRARTGYDQQLYSDFSDSDSDSLLSFSFKEDVRYPIHHPLSEHINDTTCHVLPCEFTSSANVLTSNTQADHDEPEARNSEPEVSADHHIYRCGMPSALNIASHSPILLFSNANRETDLDYDISLPRNLIELLPTADERFSSTTAVAPVLNIDCTSQTSSDCSSRSSLITNSDRTKKSQDTPVLLSDGENSRVRGLEQAADSEAEDELELCIEWGDKGTGVLSPVRSKASPEPARSDDRRGIQERRAMTEQLWQSDFLRSVSNSTGLSRPENHAIEEEDIGMSSDDGFDFATSRGCAGLYSSGRPNVEMGMELDTEDEDEWDYGWSLQE